MKEQRHEREDLCVPYVLSCVYCLSEELNLPGAKRGEACLVLSTMSNDFWESEGQGGASGLFRQVFVFEEKEEGFFPVLKKYHTDRGNLVLNMLARIRFCKLLGKLQEPFVPVDFRAYKDIMYSVILIR